jgi:large repetitive protein
MRKIVIGFIALLITGSVSGQSWNPYVNQGIVSPAPLLPAEFNGTGVLSFNVGNSGSTVLPLTTNQEMTLVITLSKGEPDAVNPLSALGGTWLGYFNWSYNAAVNTYTGIQNQDIPGSTLGNPAVGTITIQYKVTQNTPLTVASNGFNVNLQPPPYSNGFNTTDDDAVSSYTYVQAFDFGDAPASYGVASHEINLYKNINNEYENLIFLGDTIDPEPANQPSIIANGDDLNGIDDEDGVDFSQISLVLGGTTVIPVKVTVFDYGYGFLNAWIDWNGDGDFLDAGERLTPAPIAVYASGIYNIQVTVPVNAITSAPTFARFRIGSNSGATGTNAWGEVEDYQIMIQGPNLAAMITAQTNVACYGESTGSATVTATGGTPPYTYLWSTSPAQTTSTATGLPAGSYTVTVTDAVNISATATVTITQPAAALTAGSTQVNVACFGGATGSIDLTVTGGTPSYTYLWSNAATTQDITGLTAGTYTVTVTDANLCTTTHSVTITQPAAALSASVTAQTNVLCYGQSTGSLTVTASGGTSPYQYSINGGTTWQSGGTFSALAAGTYTITVTDANNCTTTTSATITQPSAPLSATVTAQTNVLCFGQSTGSLTVTASGGTSPYQYSINGGTTWQSGGTFSALAAGTYTINVKDANNCVTTTSTTITQPSAPLSASVTAQTNVLCYGQSTGSLTVTASGGTSPYQYSINGGTTWQSGGTFSALAAGTYTINVKDANNCVTTTSITITQPSAPLSASVTAQTNVLCYGQSTGSLTVTASGGTSPYQYSINGGTTWQSGGTFSALAAGTYTITVKDASNCTTTTSATITQPSTPLTASVTGQTNVLCFGQSTGSLTVTASGGTSPYQYSINGGTTWQSGGTFSALAAGTYTINVKDANNCVTTTSTTITQPSAPLSASVTAQTNVLCYGQSTGSLTVTASGGTSPYQYSINGGSTWQSGGTFSALAAGTYTITVKDANNCMTTTSTTITQPSAPLSASVTAQTSVLCYGLSTGSLTVTASGGTSPYQYSINGGSTWQSGGTFSALAAGTYTITVKDANNCTTTTSATITQPSAPLSATVTAQTNVLCFGQSTGSLTVTASGGTSPYQYSINGGTTWQSGGTFSALAAGTYTINVKDANNCVTTTSTTITQPSAPLSASVTAQTNVLCFGQSTGSLTVTASGGTSPYQYSINGGTTWQSGGTFSALAAGTYTITVKDANNCTTTTSATITQPSAPLSATVTAQTNVLCFGQSTGSLTVTASGGTSPYQYSINGGSTWQSGGTFSALAAGTYTITVKDANNCTTTTSATITQPSAPLSATVTAQTNVLCFGNATGSVAISVAGGTSPYLFSINGGVNYQSSNTFSGLTASNYIVTVKDANNCLTTVNVNITQPSAPLSATVTAQTNVLCYGQSTGSLTVTASGGTSPYQYSINGGSTWQSGGTFSALAAGTYTITVKDANNCTTTTSATITQPSTPLTASVTGQTNVLCFGQSTGSLTVTASGGTSPYQYSINGGTTWQSGGTFSALAAGTYTITVKDANNCTTTTSATITQPSAPLSATVTAQTNVLCFGQSTGSLTVTASGGTSPYQYSINGGTTWQSGGTFSALAAGTYTINVKDANNCTTTTSATIAQPSQVLLSATIVDATCGYANGSIDLSVSGGVPGYSYSWSNSSGNQDIFNLNAGNYTVTVTDQNSCSATAAYTVNNIAGPVVILTGKVDVLCFGGSTGAINVSVSGGTTPYAYSWSGPGSFTSTNANLTGLIAGTYTLTVTDGNLCTATLIVTLNQPATPLNLSVVVSQPLCFGETGSVILNASGGTAPYTYSVNNPPTTGLLTGSYTYTVLDANGCQASANVTINQAPSQLAGSITAIAEAQCNTTNTGSVTVAATTGTGTAPYTYSIDGVNYYSSGSFGNLAAGNYTVTIRDANNCVITIPATILQDHCPVAINDNFSTMINTPLAGTVAANDLLTGDGVHSFNNACSVCTGPASGTLVFNSDGSFIYTPNSNFFGSDWFVYELCDADNDCDTAIVYIFIQYPSLTLTKTSNTVPNSFVAAGNLLTYQIVVTNTGNVTLTNIQVSDPLTNLNANIASLAPGASQSFNVSYYVTQQNVINGQVYNTATATTTYNNQTITDTDDETILLLNQPPTITCPQAIVANTNQGSCITSVSGLAAVTFDPNYNITQLTWTMSGATNVSSPSTGINNLGSYTFNVGVTTITYTVIDAFGLHCLHVHLR